MARDLRRQYGRIPRRLLRAGFNPKTSLYMLICKIGQSILQVPAAHFKQLPMILGCQLDLFKMMPRLQLILSDATIQTFNNQP